jgi:hypothetical protein
MMPGFVVSLATLSGIQNAQEASLFQDKWKAHERGGKGHMKVIIRSPGSLLEEVVLECPDLNWNQVFCELDRMSRRGQVRLTMKGPGLYAVSSTTACNSSV